MQICKANRFEDRERYSTTNSFLILFQYYMQYQHKISHIVSSDSYLVEESLKLNRNLCLY